MLFSFRQKHKKVERKNEKSNRVFLSGLIARITLQRLNIITNQKKKSKKSQNSKVYSTRYSQAVSHPSTNRARHCLTSVIGREPVYSTWCGRRRNEIGISQSYTFEGFNIIPVVPISNSQTFIVRPRPNTVIHLSCL